MRMYSIPELARKLGVHRATVHRWVQKGILPATQVGTGRKIYLLPEEAVSLALAQKARGHKRPKLSEARLL